MTPQGNSRRAYYNVPVPGGARPAAMRGVAADPKAQGVVVLSSAASAETGDSEDYMNEDPEGLFHTYHNHKELLEQVSSFQELLYCVCVCRDFGPNLNRTNAH